VPLIVATGNHDSDLTEAQMRAAGMTVLNGTPVSVRAGREIRVVGDDDPERNPPFSLDRTMDRPETERQLGERMARVAGADGVEVIVVHQPDAAAAALAESNPPARLVIWGHLHTELGPTVIRHTDGSWTVVMQQGTAGGVRQPTLTSFSTPFSPPLIAADVYFYFLDNATGLITGVQPVHFTPDGTVVISPRITTGQLDQLPEPTRERLGAPAPTPAADSGR
jgi:hypothetical protein